MGTYDKLNSINILRAKQEPYSQNSKQGWQHVSMKHDTTGSVAFCMSPKGRQFQVLVLFLQNIFNLRCSTVWGPTLPILTFAVSCLKHRKTRGWVYTVWSSTGHPHITPHPSSYKKLPVCTGSQFLRFTSGSSIT